MKKYIIATLAFLIMCCSKTLADPQEVFARSFMFTRPLSSHLSTHQALWHDIIYNKKGPLFGAIHLIALYQHSVRKKKIDRYFLPDCKNELLVSGDDNAADFHNRDIRAEWLGLGQNFKGTLSLSPEQRQFGFLIEYNQDLKKLFDISLFENYWVSIAIPILAVENDLNLTQTNVSEDRAQAASPKDILEAFNQSTWKYSKVDDKHTRIRAAEVKFMLGSHLVSENYFQIAYHSILSVPTGNKQNAKFIFDPVVGNNKHIGFGGAIFFQFPLNRDTSGAAICFFTNLEGIFFIRNKQFRTFDLKDKPWSRFLLFNEKNGKQNIPGVNVLTIEALVRPYGRFDFSTGWRLKTEWFEGEIGYNLWGNDDETIKLSAPYGHPCSCKNEYRCFKKEIGIAGRTQNKTASESSIAQRIALNEITTGPNADPGNDKNSQGNDIFVPIKESDIDLESAASGSALNHKIHVSVGAVHHSEKADGFFGAGAFVDIPQKNSTLRTWAVWLKLGASF